MSNKVFNFDSDEVKSKIAYDLKLFNRMENSFDYIHATLVKLKKHVSGDSPKLIKRSFLEGKNYNWVAITSGNVKILIRAYGCHFTVYTCLEEERKWGVDKRYSAFIYHVKTNEITIDDEIEGIPKPKKDDVDYISDHYMDYFFEKPFAMFNTQMDTLIGLVRKQKVRSLWNTYSFERPKFVRIKNIHCGESINSFDELIFCAEELSSIHTTLFSENDMLKAIKKFKVGDKFEGDGIYHSGTITKVCTKVEDGCYHNVGLEVDGKWHDVYSLTMWDLNAVFPK